jgi:hypothetical protein
VIAMLKSCNGDLVVDLFDAASGYLESGFSLIPVCGDGGKGRAKAPAIPWQAYRNRRPTESEIADWFGGGAGGIAIVCGQISQLVVLDLDTEQAYETLQAACPDLIQTYTVRTRRGYHLYYRIPERVPTQRLRADSGDIKGEGSYIVAAPSVIDGVQYTPVNALEPMQLDRSRFERGLRQSRLLTPEADGIGGKRPTAASPADSLTTQKLIQQYQDTVPVDGRNNALYRVSISARRAGWSLTQAMTTLTTLHVNQPAPFDHIRETSRQRLREAIDTIRSAYRGLLSDGHRSSPDTAPGLPNSVREALLQRERSAALPRVLDCLRLHAIDLSRAYTTQELVSLCAEMGIGRNSVLKALHESSEQGERFFEMVKPPVGGGEKPDSIPRGSRIGRQACCYRVPDDERLCALLGVDPTQSDPLAPADLESSSSYRKALHRTLLARRPGQYGRGWLARRLGVSRWTLWRYNRALGIRPVPVLAYSSVAWGDVNRDLPAERSHSRADTWLQDGQGRRFPAYQGMAKALLSRGGRPVLVRQRASIYRLNTAEAAATVCWQCGDCGTMHEVEHTGDTIPAPGTCSLCQSSQTIVTQMQPKTEAKRSNRGSLPVRYGRFALDWDNVDSVVPPEDMEPAEGEWLEAPDGRRFPPIRGLAYRLIKDYGRGRVTYVARDRTFEVCHDLAGHCAALGATDLAEHFMQRSRTAEAVMSAGV